MVNSCLPEFSDFTRVFSPVKVLCNGPLVYWTVLYFTDYQSIMIKTSKTLFHKTFTFSLKEKLVNSDNLNTCIDLTKEKSITGVFLRYIMQQGLELLPNRTTSHKDCYFIQWDIASLFGIGEWNGCGVYRVIPIIILFVPTYLPTVPF